MPVRVIPNLVIGDHAGNTVAVFIDHRGGHAEHESSIPVGGLQLLDGMTGGARQAVFVEVSVHLRVLGECSGKDADGVMTAIAVPGELDSFGPRENVDAGSIERGSKGVGVQRLAPLTVGFLM